MPAKYSFIGTVSLLFLAIVWMSSANLPTGQAEGTTHNPYYFYEPESPIILPADTPKTDSLGPLHYPFPDDPGGDPVNNNYNGSLFLSNPSNVQQTINFEPGKDSSIFTVQQKIGENDFRPPTYMTQQEYQDYEFEKAWKEYWNQRNHAEEINKSKPLIPKLHVPGVVFDRIFGGNTVDIRPQGSAELIFALNISKTDNPAIPVKQRRISTFDFDEKIQLNVIGKIGDKLKLTTNYNTEATFDFENQVKLDYTGYEDEIIKKIEAGNVSLPLTGTLITGSQSLFGIKTQLQFGRTTVTSVFSQQKGKKSEVEVQGGAQTSTFEINGDNYESNKHYLLSQYFRARYDSALVKLPVINSGFNVTKVEVWVTNTNATITDTRDILAMLDLGEGAGHIKNTSTVTESPIGYAGVPKNDANSINPTAPSLFAPVLTTSPGCPNPASLRCKDAVNGLLSAQGFVQQKDYEKVIAARKLSSTEYTFNSQLGYISMNNALNPDQTLAVAFQYSYQGQTYQVGEFSTDGVPTDQLLYVKMLKSSNVSPGKDSLMWNLMMKNIYSLGAYQVKPEDFKLDVVYLNPASGTEVTYMPINTSVINGKPLIQVLNLDRLNTQFDAQPDGVFDFLDGKTINASNGRLIFPELEPFGSYLQGKIMNGDINLGATSTVFSFPQLYDSTRTSAQQFPDKNRFKIKGKYKSTTGSEISLNAPNVPQGSVTVTAGGVPLTENVDYTVDYALGRVKIINEGILQSGTPIKISLESNALFGIQSKSLLGARVDYRVNKDMNLGGTFLMLNERPLTQKVNIGDEPIRNTVVGIDGNYKAETPFLTRWIDKLPFLSTKEMSSISTSFEAAELFPGHPRSIGKDGTSYLDDFEGSQSAIDIKTAGAWTLASTPQGQPTLFPEGNSLNDLKFGYNRARLAWYVVDPIFTRNSNATPPHITTADQSSNQIREIPETELFPKKEQPSGQPINISTLDFAFYPSEKGPYNYETKPVPGISAGINASGNLNSPSSRWGGIMRKIETNDFEAANVEFIQFWLMDPFNPDNTFGTTPGELYIDIGSVSEDVLRDEKKSFENGLPGNPNFTYDVTSWGRVPNLTFTVNAFDNLEANRIQQDVGVDGLSDADERNFFKPYLDTIGKYFGVGSTAYTNANTDPSNDFYHYFRGSDYDGVSKSILERYKYYNGMEANSPATKSGEEYSTSATTIPNTEDINRDNNLQTDESYYQYRVAIDPANMMVGQNYITDAFMGNGTKKNGEAVDCNWYQFKIPVNDLAKLKVGNIEDFKSIRFIRMFVRGFDKPVVLRFARLELVRSEWRKYNFDLKAEGEYLPDDNAAGTTFVVSAVNYEENGTKSPVNYVIPPKIEQQTNSQSANLARLNEQAMSLSVCNLPDGESRAAYKNIDIDVRSYKKLKMFAHAEAVGGQALNNGDLSLFVRLGTDYTNNYYEYEIPLVVTPAGSYNNNLESDRKIVWDQKNDMEMSFASLQTAKQQRNQAIQSGSAALTSPYTLTLTDENGYTRKITLKGNPNLAAIKTIMMGVRNAKKSESKDGDDGLAKCAEIWVNELRLSDFDEKGGWATTARVTAKLADLGSVTVSGNYSTPGWGSLEKKVSERQKETRMQYDISSQLELGKFLPLSFGLKIPMYVGFSQARSNPQYNPLDPDIELKNIYKNKEFTDTEKDELRRLTQDFTQRRSINFTNVKREKQKGSTQKRNYIWNVENFALNYSFTEYTHRDVNVEGHFIKDYRGGFAYNYSISPKMIKPFEKIKLFNKKAFQLLKDFNFYPYPNRFSFLTDVDRHFSRRKTRNTTETEFEQPIFYEKHYNWLRTYDLKYDITKGLKLNFQADNTARILEPAGIIDTKEKKDSIARSYKNFGTNTLYHQRTKLDWTIPINKFPLMDWVTANASYSGNYDWTRATFTADTLGNTVRNSNQKQLNAQANMLTLYNKIPYFKKVNQKYANANNAKIKEKAKVTPPQPTKPPPQADSTKKKNEDQYVIFEYIVRSLLMVKNISLSYTENAGTLMPGYAARAQFFGMDFSDRRYTQAPGYGFVFGQQNYGGRDGFAVFSKNNGWLVKQNGVNSPFSKTGSVNLNGKAIIEPAPYLKIDLNATKTLSKNYSEFYRYYPTIDDFVAETPTQSGNFSMSFITWRSSFEPRKKDYSSKAFEKFLGDRATISSRLGQKNPNSTGSVSGLIYDGYGLTAQDVMIPAFLSAYSQSNENHSTLHTFPSIPLPNWRITYDGLSKIEVLKKAFKTVTLSHAYRSSYSVSSYTSNLKFIDADGDGFSETRDAVGNFQAQNIISSVSISEQFSPLVKVDVMMQNNITGNVEIKKDRNLSLSFANSQLTEVNGKEITVGAGYRFPNLEIHFGPKPKGKSKSTAKKGKTFKSDLNLKADVSIRNNITVIRKIVEEVAQPTAGQTVISIKTSADYVLSERLNLRLFVDRIVTKPTISTSFNSANTNAGFSIRFTLQ